MSCRLPIWALISAVVLLSAWGRSSRAWAQGDEAAYRAIIADALTEDGAGRFAESRALYEQAHRLRPSARTERGIGLASMNLRDYVEAIPHLERALTDTRNPLTDAMRAEATEQIERARRRIGTYTLHVTPADAVVTVDDDPPTTDAAGHVLVALEEHHLSVSAAGMETVTRTLRVRGGESETLEIALTPVPVVTHEEPREAPPVVQPASVVVERVERVHDDDSMQDAGVATLVAAGFLAAGTLGTTIWALAGAIPGADECARVVAGGGTCNLGVSDANTYRDVSIGLSVGLGIGTAIALGVGLGLLLSSPPRSSSTVGWRCAPGGLNVGCIFSF